MNFRQNSIRNHFSPLGAGSDQRTWTVADSESPSGASGCSVIEVGGGVPRRPGTTGGSSSGGVTSDGPSTPATEGISTTVLASPVTTPGFGQQPHMVNPMEVLMERINSGGVGGGVKQRFDSVDRGDGEVGQQEPTMTTTMTGADVTGSGAESK